MFGINYGDPGELMNKPSQKAGPRQVTMDHVDVMVADVPPELSCLKNNLEIVGCRYASDFPSAKTDGFRHLIFPWEEVDVVKFKL